VSRQACNKPNGNCIGVDKRFALPGIDPKDLLQAGQVFRHFQIRFFGKCSRPGRPLDNSIATLLAIGALRDESPGMSNLIPAGTAAGRACPPATPTAAVPVRIVWNCRALPASILTRTCSELPGDLLCLLQKGVSSSPTMCRVTTSFPLASAPPSAPGKAASQVRAQQCRVSQGTAGQAQQNEAKPGHTSRPGQGNARAGMM